jgi:hypothetical protein
MRQGENPYLDRGVIDQALGQMEERWGDEPLQQSGVPDELPSGQLGQNLRSLMRGNFRNRLQMGKDQLYQEMLAPAEVSPEANLLAANPFLPTRPDLPAQPPLRLRSAR